MNTKRKNKRMYLINRDFQMRYSGAAVVVGLVSTLLTSALILYPLYTFEILRTPRFLPPPVMVMMGIAAIVNMLLIGLLGVFITHRIAGPMYSLVRHFRMIEEGGAWKADMQLRQDDDLRYVIRNFNGMVESMAGMIQKDLEKILAIKAQINELDSLEEISPILQSLEQLESEILARIPPLSDRAG